MTMTAPPMTDFRVKSTELLTRTLLDLAANPDGWGQDDWAARDKTTGHVKTCFAMRAIQLAEPGAEIDWVQHDLADLGFEVATSVVLHGQQVDIDDLAIELLGLTGNEAEVLFDGSNTMQDLTSIVETLIQHQIDGLVPKPKRSWVSMPLGFKRISGRRKPRTTEDD